MREPILLSPLGFGCAPVMGKIGKLKSLSAMEEAFDLGVTHFDVARSYGFGHAESIVGQFISGRRDRVTITSKFGVVPPDLNWITKALIPCARWISNIAPQFKSNLRKQSKQILKKRNFDVLYARQCLEQTLNSLGTDYLDIYLIHEPDPTLCENYGELFEFLEECVSYGKIRRWGLAYQKAEDYVVKFFGNIDIIQFEGNFKTVASIGDILNDPCQRIITRPFMGGMPIDFFDDKNERLAELRSMINDTGFSLSDASILLARKLAGNGGSVICSMFSSEHIRSNVRAFYEFKDNEKMNALFNHLIISRN